MIERRKAIIAGIRGKKAGEKMLTAICEGAEAYYQFGGHHRVILCRTYHGLFYWARVPNSSNKIGRFFDINKQIHTFRADGFIGLT